LLNRFLEDDFVQIIWSSISHSLRENNGFFHRYSLSEKKRTAYDLTISYQKLTQLITEKGFAIP
jgi:hypothetical protein